MSIKNLKSVIKSNATPIVVLVTIALTLLVNHIVKGNIQLMIIYAIVAILTAMFAGKVCKAIAKLINSIKSAIEARKVAKSNKKQMKNGVKAILVIILLFVIFGICEALFPAKENKPLPISNDDPVIVDTDCTGKEDCNTTDSESDSSKPVFVVPSTREKVVPQEKVIETTTKSQEQEKTVITSGSTTNEINVVDNSKSKEKAIEKANNNGEETTELNKNVIVGLAKDDEKEEEVTPVTEPKKIVLEDKKIEVLPQGEESAPNAANTSEEDTSKLVADEDTDDLMKVISENIKAEETKDAESKVAETKSEVEEPKEEVVVTEEVVTVDNEAKGFDGFNTVEEPKAEEKVEEEVVVAKEEVKAPTVSSNTINAFTGDTVQFTFSGENVKVSGADNISVVGNTVSFQAGDEATVYEIEVANEAGSQTVIVVVSSPFNN